MIRDSKPELIILDFNLTGWGGSDAAEMDSKAFIQRCKQQWPNLPCITLVDTPRQIRPAIEAGADTTLLKGFNIAQLLERIDHLLLQQRAPVGGYATP
jgi:DNA-binding NarL/FixJ family response regulator